MIKTQFIACAGLAMLLASVSPAHAQNSGPAPEESLSGSFVSVPELTYYFDRRSNAPEDHAQRKLYVER